VTPGAPPFLAKELRSMPKQYMTLVLYNNPVLCRDVSRVTLPG
jgi:hypothetical protein